jgi:hypothetical protein
MIKLKYQLATIATAMLAANAYAQPVVPDQTQDSQQCPGATSSTSTAQCPQQPGTSATAGAGVQTPVAGAQVGGQVGTQQPLQQPMQQQPTYYQPAAPPPEGTYVAPERPWYEHQFAISVGGGVDDFARSNARRQTNIGGSWNARVTLGAHSYVAAELSYIGSAQTLKMFGSDQTLYGNGAQGAVRLNLLPDLAVTPFAYGGAAWRYYSTSGGTFGNTHDDKLEVPVGGGIAAYVADMMFDVRGEYRIAPNDEHISGNATGVEALSGNFDRWGVTGNVGAVF